MNTTHKGCSQVQQKKARLFPSRCGLRYKFDHGSQGNEGGDHPAGQAGMWEGAFRASV